MGDTKARRDTRQRQVILEELRKVTSHPTAAQLYEAARRRLPKISLGTVYRNLELLTREGIVHRLDFTGAESRFDANTASHCHVRCVRCGRVDDVCEPSADIAAERFKSLSGYDIIGHRLEFVGVCPRCKGPAKTQDDQTFGAEGA